MPSPSSFLPSQLVEARPLATVSVRMLPFLALLAIALPSASAQSKASPPGLQQHYDAARTFALSGDQDRAAAEYKAFLAEALRQIANLRTRERDYASAIPLFAQAVEIAPEISAVRQDFASALLSSGDPNGGTSGASGSQRQSGGVPSGTSPV